MIDSASIEPWLTVPDGSKALDFYKNAFGASDTYRMDGENNDLVARLTVGGAGFWISNGPVQPRENGGDNIRMILIVDDPDFLFAQALKAGATEVSPVREEYGWRLGRLSDPFGFHWEIGHTL
jgi:PhnB protein